MDWEYQGFEDKLAQLHDVVADDRKAFKGRLRVLRDMGVPDKPSPGSGKRLTFSARDLFEVHVALTLAEFGLPPLRIALAVKFLRPWSIIDEVRSREETTWLMLSLQSNVGKAQDFGEDIKTFVQLVDTGSAAGWFPFTAEPRGRPRWTAFINATDLVRNIER